MQYKTALSLAKILAGIFIACLIFELFLQINDRSSVDQGVIDPVSGLSHKEPNASYVESRACYSNVATTNSLGFHAPEPPQGEKAKNEFRIVVVGSSFVEGGSVPIDQMLTSDLERLLNADPKRKYTYEVIPVAFSGNGEYLDILYYLRYGRPLHPDLVINLNTEFEIGKDGASGNYYDADGKLITTLQTPVPNSSVAHIKDLIKQSKLAYTLYSRFFTLKAEQESQADAGASASSEVRDAQWVLHTKLINDFVHMVSDDKAKFMMMSWPSHEASPDVAQELHNNLADASVADRFSYLDLQPIIAADVQKTGESASWACDAHWSAAGNSYVAQALYDYFKTHPTLITKS